MPLSDAALITATSPIFTVFYARIFLKEPILKIDLLNVILIVVGMVFIAKPPFIFGHNYVFEYDTSGVYALILLTSATVFIQPNVFIVLRFMKGFHYLHNHFNLHVCPSIMSCKSFSSSSCTSNCH